MNPVVTYEMDYYIFDQEIIYILSRAEKNGKQKLLKTVGSIIKEVKETLTI